jgi:jumonji domain-containing protein 2
MDLYSINYVHFGAPKFWYGVPSEHAKKFEEVAKAHFPSEWKECKQFLRHKTTMISPSILTKNNITMNYVVQQPGEFVITFPLSYHAGFNTGYVLVTSTAC